VTERAVCLTCRAVVAAGAGCGVDEAHQVATLGAPDGRAGLVDAVWGAAAERGYTLRELERSAHGQLRMSVTGLATAAGGAFFLGPGSGALVLLAGVAGAATGHLVGYLRSRRRVLTHPRGAGDLALPGPVARGRIRRAPSIESPVSGSPCAAWAFELRFEGAWGERVMLRAAETAGLEVTLDGGAQARIAAGPAIVVGAMSQIDDIESGELEDFLRRLDPARTPDPEPFPPLPYNVVLEHTAFVGDRIELLGELVPDVVATAPQRLYRDAPSTVLRPRGVPVLRLP
jgi:hypothetical protein